MTAIIPIVPLGNAARPSKPGASDAAGAANAYLRPGVLNLRALPPLSLYIHFPWCVRKCPYCDFNSHEVQGELPEAAYLDAVRADLEGALPLIWGRKIHTVFIGGGTPSLLSAGGLDRLLSDVRTLLPLDGAAEITMEANPGTFEVDKFRAFRDSGVNRLSVGIQSFNPTHLAALGRIHDGKDARRAVEIALATFDNVNLDLMYALPGQTLAAAQADLELALDYAPSHLSMYHLTIEPNTYFAKFPPVIPDDDLSADMQQMIHDGAAQAGFGHYEVSAFARAGRQARHNLNYWQFGDYLGIGAGAHSKLSFPHRIVRQSRYRQPKAYLAAMANGMAIEHEAEIGYDELGFEFMLNALRLCEGVPVSLFAERTGLPLHAVEPAMLLAEQKGLLHFDHLRVAPTELGQRFLNDLQQIFLAA
ncbi:MAG: radical SAM family heme chaperone HemW [Pseudomonadota bacterium]|nr:radical SAM family heme chaperone HemW [Pseudomonadota bacterium]